MLKLICAKEPGVNSVTVVANNFVIADYRHSRGVDYIDAHKKWN